MATKNAKKTDVKSVAEGTQVPTPFQDRIIITKKAPETKSAGGIIIPVGVQVKENQGYVVAVGPTVGLSYSASRMVIGEEKSPYIPKVGDKVLFGEYAGMTVIFEGTEYLVVKEADVLAKI